MRRIVQSKRLQGVRHGLRGHIAAEVAMLENEGHKILRLNVDDPAAFRVPAPEPIVADMVHNIRDSQGYSDARGIYSARTAVAQYYQSRGLVRTDVDDVFLGNGVSELISLVLQAFIDAGDEILLPAPGYPLWSAAVTLQGGVAVHYSCDEADGWLPDLEDMEARITPQTRAIVVINPNNPTGAVYPAETVAGIVDIARRHDLAVFSDEVYEKIVYDDATHVHTASHTGSDVVCLTFSGLSKAYRAAGYRAGWVVVSGPRHVADDFLEGLMTLANMRLCPNVPAQHAIQTALGGYQSINEYIRPGGRFHEQSKVGAELLNQIDGVSCVAPRGALCCFPRIDPEMYALGGDERFVVDLLKEQKVLLTHGSALSWTDTDHFRMVTLAEVPVLTDAMSRIAEFLATRRV